MKNGQKIDVDQMDIRLWPDCKISPPDKELPLEFWQVILVNSKVILLVSYENVKVNLKLI